MTVARAPERERDYLTRSLHPYVGLRAYDPEDRERWWLVSLDIIDGGVEVYAWGNTRIGSGYYRTGGAWTCDDDRVRAILDLVTAKALAWESVMAGYRNGLLP